VRDRSEPTKEPCDKESGLSRRGTKRARRGTKRAPAGSLAGMQGLRALWRPIDMKL
jgi:hypothetical protein